MFRVTLSRLRRLILPCAVPQFVGGDKNFSLYPSYKVRNLFRRDAKKILKPIIFEEAFSEAVKRAIDEPKGKLPMNTRSFSKAKNEENLVSPETPTKSGTRVNSGCCSF